MARKGMGHRLGYVNMLSKQELTKAHEGMLSVLRTTGVTVKDKQMQKVLADYGCQVDTALDRVYMGLDVVERALSNCPKGFVGTARDPQNNISFAPRNTTYFLNACGTKLLDLDTGEMHEPTRKEFYDYLRLLDALPNVDIQNCFPLFGFQKVPECMKLLESAAAKYRVSTKVQIEGTVFDNFRFSTEMAKAVGVDLFQIVNSAAPLTYFTETAEQIRTYAQGGLPFHFASGPTRGLTSPMTAVGAAIANNAEAMAGIVMAQAVRPGARVWVNSMIMTPDMQSGKPAFGDIGNSVTDMVFNQMWRQWGIPCWSNAASWTSAKSIDYQAGYEMAIALVTQAMSGATAISFQGGLYAELCVHPAKAVMDDDVVGMVKRLMEGPNTTEEGYAVELINQTGPMPGNFMDSDPTLDGWREECYIPTVASREPYESWLKNGKRNILEFAREKAEDMVASHKIEMLATIQEDGIETILKEARQYYRSKGLISDGEWKLYMEDLNSPNYPFA